MAKKNRKASEDKKTENESAEIEAELTEATQGEGEASDVPIPADEASADDLLDDVRRSLIEGESQAEEEKKSKWWNKITKGFQKDQAAEQAPDVVAAPAVEPPAQEQKEDAYVDQIDDLIDMLDSDDAPVMEKIAEAETVAPLTAEPEPAVDLEELKKRVFNQRETGAEQETSAVRSILEGEEEVFVEVEAKKVDTREERVRAFENALRPYQLYINLALALVAVVVAAMVGVVMFRVYQQTRPPEPTQIPSNLPFPRSMTLPGGLNFNLGKGALADGQWNPRGPEWLEGTEICRWVAIPWSAQSEAVVRTFTQEDTIELVMSNNDRLTYSVHSIQQLTLAEMQELDQNTPCLLLVLAKQDSEKRWVVTANP